jgi:hypothetical protein
MTSVMISLLALISLVLFAVGAYFLAAGTYFLTQDLVVGIAMVTIGPLFLYGAYLFGRSAWRTHRDLAAHPPNEQQRRERRRVSLATGVGVGASAVGGFVAAPDAGVRLILVIGIVIIFGSLLAFEFEPKKPRDQ